MQMHAPHANHNHNYNYNLSHNHNHNLSHNLSHNHNHNHNLSHNLSLNCNQNHMPRPQPDGPGRQEREKVCFLFSVEPSAFFPKIAPKFLLPRNSLFVDTCAAAW